MFHLPFKVLDIVDIRCTTCLRLVFTILPDNWNNDIKCCFVGQGMQVYACNFYIEEFA